MNSLFNKLAICITKHLLLIKVSTHIYAQTENCHASVDNRHSVNQTLRYARKFLGNPIVTNICCCEPYIYFFLNVFMKDYLHGVTCKSKLGQTSLKLINNKIKMQQINFW